jgi:cyclopropane fatty-acyl-phospholipid synthase-like methyltransferase
VNDAEMNGAGERTSDTAMPYDYFRDMYDGSPDPWGFDRRWYELRKYAITMASLPRPMYRRALEPGCSNGALTERLAPRCEELIAFDFVVDAVQRCRERTSSDGGVEVRCESFPDFWPTGHGDLVVWSEVAYYLGDEQAAAALAGLERWLEVGGNVVAVHYTGATNYPRRGADIVPWLDGADFLARRCHHVDDEFELGVWERLATPRAGTDD